MRARVPNGRRSFSAVMNQVGASCRFKTASPFGKALGHASARIAMY